MTATKNAVAALTATALRMKSEKETAMPHDSNITEVGLIDAVRNLMDAASVPATCTSRVGCSSPQVDQATKDALSVLGVNSSQCAEHTREHLRELLTVTQEAA